MGYIRVEWPWSQEWMSEEYEDEVEYGEESFVDELPTETQINDLLWFERDFIAEHLGYKDWEEYEYRKDEDEEEDE